LKQDLYSEAKEGQSQTPFCKMPPIQVLQNTPQAICFT